MVRKTLWLFVSCLMVLSLVIASCGGGEDGEKEKPDDGDKEVVDTFDEAIYDGTFNRIGLGSGYSNIDYAAGRTMFTPFAMGEELLGGDWARGPAGTGENEWTGGFAGFIDWLTGKLAESWSMPDNETLLYNLRHDVKWWNKPPANGRGLVAEDIVWNLERIFSTELSYLRNTYTVIDKSPTGFKALDDYTVEVKVHPEWQGLMATVVGDFAWHLYPGVDMGDDDILDADEWQNFIGTGAFMMTNWVTESYIVYERNPDWYMTDPVLKGNKLPYCAGAKETIIPDKSTQLAAFRTGQVDMMSWGVNLEDVQQLTAAEPRLMFGNWPAASISHIWPRLDKGLPWDDINVRIAANLAVNQPELVEDYYGGYADILGWPYPNLKVFEPVYTPLEQQSQLVQDCFGYDLERAKTLLAEAGYPDGFKCKLTCNANQADFLAIIVEYLSKVGIEMELEVLEGTAHFSTWINRTYDEMFYANDYVGNAYRMMCMVSTSLYNYSFFEHPRTEAAVQQISEALGKDDAAVARVMKEIGPFELDQVVPIYMPSPHRYVIWWPWLQNFYGATEGGGYSNLDEYLGYIWIDEGLKQEMGY
ncbi:MAG: ABC transporter substrate-binding protein [Dehalococcoidales bacterium]|nr:MAG: ABC transporter substrate-binding protein [Dehalococcoidales bacterium]